MADEEPPQYGQPGVAQFPITTALEFPEWPVQRSLGMVFGVVVRSMGIGKGITAGFKAMAGGEVKQYTRLVEDSRRHAMDRMIENARLVGANGIIAMRFDSSEVGQSLTEIVAYCTAVIVGAN
ncbi:MAG TPA: heavy metal-binding domain-containing protein [Acidimicrobiales bacterium]|nr:heavy metal-binding domain-containing protein [Acidimicrobiales bacterium]